ncbi:MAG: ABC transporter permease [Chloroflexota bacterium]
MGNIRRTGKPRVERNWRLAMNLSLVSRARLYGRVVWNAFEMTLRANLIDSWVLFGILVQPLMVAVLAFWMLQGRGGEYVIFVVIGSGMTGLWTSLLFISGNSITEERWTGTLELLVGAPTPISLVVFGKILANTVQSLLSMIACYSLAIVVFGYTPEIAQPGPFFASLGLAVLSYVCFGLIVSPVFVINPDVQRLQNGLEFPVYILCGFLFPIALLPGWTTPLSYLLTPYWAAQALHITSGGGQAGAPGLWLCWGMMALVSAVYLLASRWLFRRLLFRARERATLSMQ